MCSSGDTFFAAIVTEPTLIAVTRQMTCLEWLRERERLDSPEVGVPSGQKRSRGSASELLQFLQAKGVVVSSEERKVGRCKKFLRRKEFLLAD